MKEYNLSDGYGLALRIKSIGSKFWIFNHQRPITKKRANLTQGKFLLGDITAPQAIKTIKPIANQGKLETVGRLCRSLNEIMTFAVNTGVIEHNRLAGIGKAFETAKVTNQTSLDPKDLPELLKTIN